MRHAAMLALIRMIPTPLETSESNLGLISQRVVDDSTYSPNYPDTTLPACGAVFEYMDGSQSHWMLDRINCPACLVMIDTGIHLGLVITEQRPGGFVIDSQLRWPMGFFD